jgi:hypothetical protein
MMEKLTPYSSRFFFKMQGRSMSSAVSISRGIIGRNRVSDSALPKPCLSWQNATAAAVGQSALPARRRPLVAASRRPGWSSGGRRDRTVSDPGGCISPVSRTPDRRCRRAAPGSTLPSPACARRSLSPVRPWTPMGDRPGEGRRVAGGHPHPDPRQALARGWRSRTICFRRSSRTWV